MPLLQSSLEMPIPPEGSPVLSPILPLRKMSTGVRSYLELQAFIDKSEDALDDIKSSTKQTTEYDGLWTASPDKSILDHVQRSPSDVLPLVVSMRRELAEAMERNLASSGANSEIQMENETMRQSLHEQIKLANEVRTDVQQCLYETSKLSQQSLAIHSQQIKLEHRIEELQWETHDWESQCRHVEHPCMPHTHYATNYLVDKGLVDVNGAVKDIHVTYFQMSIDQMIQGIHAGVPQRAAEAIKQVVISVGQITGGLTDDTRRKLGDTLGRVSLILDSLLIEAERVESDEDLRSLSRLEADASALTTAVIDLLRMVRIKPTSQNELMASAGDALSSVISVESPPGFYVIPASIQSRHAAKQDIEGHRKANPRFSSASSVYSNISGADSGDTPCSHA